MFCSKCGAKLPDNSAFCSHCGQPLSGSNEKQTWSQQTYIPPQPPRMPQAPVTPNPAKTAHTGMIVLICVLGTVAAAALVFLGIKLFAPPQTDSQAFAQAYSSLLESAAFGNSSAGAAQSPIPAASVPPATSATPTIAPAATPTAAPTPAPTAAPAPDPTAAPTPGPTTAPTAAPTQKPQDAADVFANGFVMDVESYLDNTWWASAGKSIDNPDAAAVAAGYPKDYQLRYAENQYIFYSDTQTVQMLYQDENGNVTDKGEFEYTIDPFGFYIYSFFRTFAIDGVDHEICSAFFVCDDVLYEVEMMDGYAVSNYIAYDPYGD